MSGELDSRVDLESTFSTLANGIIAGPDDLMGLGECLNMLETVATAGRPSSGRTELFREIEQLCNRIILDESPDPQADWTTVQGKISRLLERARQELADPARASVPSSDPAGDTVRSDDQQNMEEEMEQQVDSPAAETEVTAVDEILDPELLTDFIEEARENLSSIEINILTLESDPQDTDAINAVFRPFHSIKGVSGFLNLGDINRLSHQVENLLDEARNGTLPVTERLTDVVLQATDILNELIDELENTEDPNAIVHSGSPRVTAFLEEVKHFHDGDHTALAPQQTTTPPAQQPDPQPEAEGEDEDDGALDLDEELLSDFIEEARENLSSIELNVLAMEADPEDKDAINAVFRPFHSIKGVAGFLNLKTIHRLSHQVENLLDAVRNGTMVVDDRLIDIVLKSTDVLKELLEELEGSDRPAALAKAPSPKVNALLELIKDFEEGEPPQLLGGERKVGEILVAHEMVQEKVVEEAADKGQKQNKKIGEVLVSEKKAPVQDVSKALRQQRHSKESSAFVRVATQKLDNLVDGIGELVIAQSMVLENTSLLAIKDQKLQKDIVQLSRITAELQRISMSMRMVPIKNTFKKLIRLVRDLAKKSGKEITLELRGEETEIDRNMVEEIYEPLVHMIRNAADHGIEMPEERERVGKPRCGKIRVAAEQSAGSIIIEIRDDGRGLDVDKIRQRALEREIISPQDNLPDSVIYDLIFHPGFSTKEKVTEVSGRGVGMDVVKKTVEKLKGKIETSSVLGEGSRFQLKLPLTMAIIDGMVIKVGQQKYVVPTIALKESLRPSPKDYYTVQGSGEMVKVRESIMPLIRLHNLFDVEPSCKNPWDGLLLVVTEGDRSFCLLADEIVGRQEVVIKGLGASLRNLVGISGGAILGDGRVALIVDVKGIVNLYEEKAA